MTILWKKPDIKGGVRQWRRRNKFMKKDFRCSMALIRIIKKLKLAR
jgi:hypothetical protein